MRVAPGKNEPSGAQRVPVTAVAVAVSLLASCIQALLWVSRTGDGGVWSKWELFCSLSASDLAHGQWWRVWTFPLIHCGLIHSIAGVAGIATLGRCVEPIIGGIRFLVILLLGSVLGGVAQCAAVGWEFAPKCALVGTAPAVFTLIGAYGTLIPDWPVGAASRWGRSRIRARHVRWLAFMGTLGLWVSGSVPEIGPVAMATATAVGWGATRCIGFGDTSFYERRRKSHLEEQMHEEGLNWNDFVARELDPILEKIARKGLKSLTRAERRILRAGQKRLMEGSDDVLPQHKMTPERGKNGPSLTHNS